MVALCLFWVWRGVPDSAAACALRQFGAWAQISASVLTRSLTGQVYTCAIMHLQCRNMSITWPAPLPLLSLCMNWAHLVGAW